MINLFNYNPKELIQTKNNQNRKSELKSIIFTSPKKQINTIKNKLQLQATNSKDTSKDTTKDSTNNNNTNDSDNENDESKSDEKQNDIKHEQGGMYTMNVYYIYHI